MFEIVAEYDLTQDPDTLTALDVKNAEGTVISNNADEAAFITNAAEGKIETKVINNAGAELPSTGGIGTTIFYIVGGILVLGAVVVLVTRKRMGAAE